MQKPWYHLENPDKIDSPSLLVFPSRIKSNIAKMISIAGGTERLRPHVKTHKMAEVAKLHIDQGITKFKCATIAEAEMLAQAGAQKILLAHQPVGPKLIRYLSLAQAFSKVSFETLVDDLSILQGISVACAQKKVEIGIWLDLDNGMARSGIAPSDTAFEIYSAIQQLPYLHPSGLHAYDGHFREAEFGQRKSHSDAAFEKVYAFKNRLVEAGLSVPSIVAGGSPTFPVHAMREEVELSPGTYVFWDAGYGQQFADMGFEHAALVMTRVISKPGTHRITLDLGHKSIASENPIDKRVRLLGIEHATFVGHSEEHLVLEVANPHDIHVGDVFLGIPWHICPTVALHQKAYIIEGGNCIDEWNVTARDRILEF